MMSCTEQLLILEVMFILIILPWNRSLTAQASLARPNCLDRCGNIPIPFPFGIGRGCFWYENYEMVCEQRPPDLSSPLLRLTMKSLPAELEVLDISRTNSTMTFACPVDLMTSGLLEILHKNSVFHNFDTNTNISVSIVRSWQVIRRSDTPTSGINCTSDSVRECYSNLTGSSIVYEGRCRDGYQGNPYLQDGCEDINECEEDPQMRLNCPHCQNLPGSYICRSARTVSNHIIMGIGYGLGALVSIFFAWKLYKVIKKRRKMKLKQKYFKQNGGLLLQQHLSSSKDNVEKNKLFNSKELEKATDHFNDDRILGRGGQGMVYKGMLTDGRIVAVKKSKSIGKGNIENFINEVFILANISHRNVVKLLGFCLETKVPLLVYEYIPNGTLYHYIHNPNEEFHLTWEVRIQIAAEVAGALSYLHSAASIPIYHRDIKSTNILLDDKYRAKIADFGTSKSVALDQTHLTIQVQGTFGYLDPEYFRSGKFTDKSDVYSFGVVLVELLTGKKPISSAESNDEMCRGLAIYFVECLKEDRLSAIVDDHIWSQGRKEEIVAFADLARRCLSSNGKKRPTMKEVTLELESIRELSGKYSIEHSNQDDDDEEEFLARGIGKLDVALITPLQTETLANVTSLPGDA